jgi:3-methyladenine DNA glycosylase AlkD
MPNKAAGTTELADVMSELEKKGSQQTRKTYARHGVNIPMFGVKIADLKTIAKKIKGQQDLALALYDTGNYDAMYLAGMVADGSQMSKLQLEKWASATSCETLCGYAVPWVATESPLGRELALKWIASKNDAVAICGWTTYAGIIATTPDEDLFFEEIRSLLAQIVAGIHTAPNKVRYVMNQFVIAVGAYVKPLLTEAKKAAQAIGTVSVDMGDTACKVPDASEYIHKIEAMGRVGKKRKTMRC